MALPAPTASGLAPLRPEIKLAADRADRLTRVHAALKRIASVTIPTVTKEHGHRVFVMKLQYKANEAEAQGWGLPSSMDPTSGQVHIKRRFTDFWNLRHELLYSASSSHRHQHQNHRCAFCTRILNALEQAPALPRAHQRVFYNHETVRQELEDFANLALQVSARAPSGHWCKARGVVPSLVHQFLVGDENEEEEKGSTARPTGWVYTLSW